MKLSGIKAGVESSILADILRGHGERERSFNTHSLILGSQFEFIGGILHALGCIPRSRFA
jgi:hypothetical protein